MSNITHQDLNDTIIGDNTWTCKTFDTTEKGCPKFQISEDDTYIVELRPRDGWRNLIFGPLIRESRFLKVVRGSETGPGWMRLYTRLQKMGYDVRISLIKTSRLDFLKMRYTFWDGTHSTCSAYRAYLESEVVSPEKFYKFLSRPENGLHLLQEAIQKQLGQHILNYVMKGGKPNATIEGGRIDDPILEDAGYRVNSFILFYCTEKEISANQNIGH